MTRLILGVATFGVGLLSLTGFIKDDQVAGLLALGVGMMGLGCIGIIAAIENRTQSNRRICERCLRRTP
jgi:hypothetical protein